MRYVLDGERLNPSDLLTFDQFEELLDRELSENHGMGLFDLPDVHCWADEYDERRNLEQSVKLVRRLAKTIMKKAMSFDYF